MVFWIKPVSGGEEDYRPFEIKNISGGGILCLTDEAFEQGDKVNVSFELPQHTDLIEALACVRHVHRNQEGSVEMGLQFESVKGLPTALLIDYLEELFK
jgi:c-di-GMP-binding flagellar brake protein YcgR